MDLEHLWARHGEWIRAAVRRHLGRGWEDGVQEVLLKLEPALARQADSGPEALRALVSRTVRSVCIDELRRRALEPRAAPEEHPLEELPERADGAGLERDETLARARASWERLPERERSLLVLRFRDGLSLREIAELLGVPQGSVAGWYSRALARLREELT